MLTPTQKRLYVRHLLLTEIGEAGQERLCGTRVGFAPNASTRAADVAWEYLARAGVTRADAGASDALAVDVPDAATVERLAGSALLVDAAATLAGAFAAVEAIKAAVGAGRAARLPADLALAKDPD